MSFDLVRTASTARRETARRQWRTWPADLSARNAIIGATNRDGHRTSHAGGGAVPLARFAPGDVRWSATAAAQRTARRRPGFYDEVLLGRTCHGASTDEAVATGFLLRREAVQLIAALEANRAFFE
jgi:hypothetical protein